MNASALLAPFADRLHRARLEHVDAVVRPMAGSRTLAPGPDADRVLVAGGGIAAGLGVRSQQAALPGRLADHLSALTGRGAVVDVAAVPGLRLAEAAELLDGVRLEHVDAVVLTLGTSEAYELTSLRRWEAGLDRLLDRIDERRADGTLVLLASAAPLQRAFGDDRALRGAREAHALALDAVTRRVAARRDHVRFQETGEPGLAVRWSSAFDYDRLARRLAPVLRGHLDAAAVATSARTARALRGSSDPELLRQQALERSGLLRLEPDAALESLLRLLADRMGVRAAAVTLLDGDTLRMQAVVGTEAVEMPRRIAMCNHTIRKDRAHIEADLAGHPLADAGWRFYAGFPIESPDGYRVGAVCLLDELPRHGATIDVDVIADLATRVQNELWEAIDRRRRLLLADAAAPAMSIAGATPTR